MILLASMILGWLSIGLVAGRVTFRREMRKVASRTESIDRSRWVNGRNIYKPEEKETKEFRDAKDTAQMVVLLWPGFLIAGVFVWIFAGPGKWLTSLTPDEKRAIRLKKVEAQKAQIAEAEKAILEWDIDKVERALTAMKEKDSEVK